MADALLKCLVIMRNVAMVSLLSLSFCFAACADDETPATAPPAAPTAIVGETDAGLPFEAPTVVSPVATTLPPAPPAPPVLVDDANDAAAPPAPPAPSLDLDAGVEDAGPKDDASDAGDILIVVPVLLVGAIHVTESSGASCYYSIDGVQNATSKPVLDATLGIGTHQVMCHTSDGREVTKSVNVQAGVTTNVVLTLPPPPPPPAPGTLVAVAVGGSCSFYLNGVSKGTTAQLKLTVAPGSYSIACYVEGTSKGTRSVIIKSNETAMAMFKLTE